MGPRARPVIPVNSPWLGGRETDLVLECLRSGWISSSGRFVVELEQGIAARCGRRFGVAVSSGTTALELSLAALDLEPGAEVILPSFTIISCAAAVLRAGAVPVLVDATPDTGCLDVSRLAARVGPRTRAIMPVHIYGHPVDLDPLLALAERHHLAVVEDAAEALGAEYRTSLRDAVAFRPCGSFGRMSCFSFYANKPITTGEGGMIVLDDEPLAARLRSMRDLCFDPARRFRHEELGFNFRMTNLQAALGVAQLERFEAIVERKRAIAGRLRAGLGELSGVHQPVEHPWARCIYWMYGLVLDEALGFDAARLAEQLLARGVETRPYFLGLHEQPALRKRGLFSGETYPVTERLARRGLYLPSGLGLADDELDRVCEAVHDALRALA